MGREDREDAPFRGDSRSTGKALERVYVGAVQPSGEVLVLGAVVPCFQRASGSPGGWLKQIAGVLHPSHPAQGF